LFLVKRKNCPSNARTSGESDMCKLLKICCVREKLKICNCFKAFR